MTQTYRLNHGRNMYQKMRSVVDPLRGPEAFRYEVLKNAFSDEH